MSTQPSNGSGEAMPLPGAQFKRFLALFHTIFVLGVIFSLILRWRRDSFLWQANEAWLIALVVLQLGLYFLFFVFQWKPPTAVGWWLAYFALSFSIWYAEWSFEPGLQWTAWAYLGQMFGVLRPRISVPIGTVIFGLYFARAFAGRTLNIWEVLAAVSLMTTVTGLGLFLHRLTITSSERAELIRELELAKQELERAREKDIELAALRERERLARDLHDSLGHGLVTLTVQLEAAQRLYPLDPAKASAMLDGMKELTRTSMEELRRALAGLRAPGLGDQPLLSALQGLCQEAGKENLMVTCTIAPGTEKLTPAVCESLWRVAQEGLHNVAKHAAARAASLSLTLDPGEVVLLVADNGRGISVADLDRPGHYGLRGLRERVEGLGGRFSIGSNGTGTRLEARLPLVAS